MKIEQTDSNKLQATIHIVLEQEDYKDKYIQELKKYRKKSHMKGFRKGKAPLSALKKMYGKAVLAEVIDEVLQKSLNNYLKDNKLDILGQPLPSEKQEKLDLDLNSMKDYEFSFDIGLLPEIDLKGIEEDSRYDQYKVVLPKSLLEEELNLRRRRFGQNVEVEDIIEENDLLTIHANELLDGEVKKDGWETGFKILVNRIDDEEVKSDLLKKKKGDTFHFNVRKLEKNTNEKYIRHYLLNLDEDEDIEVGNDFQGVVKLVSRVEPVELNQEFYDKAFGEDNVHSEEEALSRLEKELEKYYKDQERNYTLRLIMEDLMEKNEIELPEEFLKRWMKTSNDYHEDGGFENEYKQFKKNLKWTLIRKKIAKKFEIEVSAQDVQEHVRNKIEAYFQDIQEETPDIDSIAGEYLKKEDQIQKEYEEILANKVFETITGHVTLTTKEIDIEEFKEKVSELNKKINE